MDRRNFLTKSCMSCFGAGLAFTFLQSCSTSSQLLQGSISGSDLVIDAVEFVNKGTENKFKKYVIVAHEQLKFPICVYRINENTYSALLMECTHQGAELQVFGDKMQCPAHGSEFDNHGDATSGPATDPLRSFPVTIINNQLKISLK
ncbi:Rieske 2Fe-2S domain-containing protein [Flavobacterium sp. TAB 87]|uniref:Rieske (2Fe-2S) protein n=1 Tax=Flavobacterium sp. TAB 87 TaxID=1729581 RepID=UPI00076D7489|nr:Rieske 2Fe-2S domain-containing protein [Flavobacterium sp. TAB 87]KVV15432.1 3-phenylpropionate dioxygenase ferredoxin subunit [Flavobacterium sp. TAB 87]